MKLTKCADDNGTRRTPAGKEHLRIPAFAFLHLFENAKPQGYKGKE